MRCTSALVLWLGIALPIGCSGDGGGPDGGSPTVLDGFAGPLWPCSEPGKPCEAHNSCVTSATCGNDRLCHPVEVQNCDDGLDCTQDTCAGRGICKNIPRPGTCALPVKLQKDGTFTTELRCFTENEKNPGDPCQMCKPTGDAGSGGTAWAPASGGSCDDGNPCTKNDYCQAGTCKGEDYSLSCADKLACTEDTCDGKGGCLDHKLRPDWCLIDGVCYKDQQPDDNTGCQQCDVKVSQNTWSPLGAHCQIAGKCYKSGQKDPVAPTCAECDPAKDAKAWTIIPGMCRIEGACYKSGDKDQAGCSVCDPAKSQLTWTPLPQTCKISGKCYSAGAKDPTGCGECDPAASTSTWTVKGANCLIGSTCFAAGQTQPGGCGVCDPARSRSGWSAPADQCLIGQTCVANLAKDSTGCRLCDTSKSTLGWTPAAGIPATTSTFEDGKTPAGWSLSNTTPPIGWVVCNRRALEGSFALYYGDPAAGGFETLGIGNSGNADLPTVTLTAGKKAGLAFWLYLDTESLFPLAPVFEVQVNGAAVWTRPANFAMRVWQEVLIDLSASAGKSVSVRFRVDTSKSLFNFGEGVFIDAVTLYHGC